MNTELSGKNSLTYILLIVLTGFICYFNAISVGFCALDDVTLINWLHRSHLSFVDFFFTDGTTKYYRPLLLVSFLSDFSIFGYNSAGFHMVNILLHVLNAVLVFFIGTELLKDVERKEDIALLASLIFALHPVNTEAVVWISARSDLLSCVFVLCSVLLLIKKRYKMSVYAVVFLFLTYLCALLAKESALMLLPFAFVYFFLERNKIALRRSALPLLALSVATLTYFVLRSGLHFAMDRGLEKAMAGNGVIQNAVLNDLAAYGFYFRKMVYPFPLHIAITHISVNTNLIIFFMGLSILAYLWRKHELIRLPALILLTGLLPPIFALNGSLPWTPYAERYTYIPLTGIALILALALVHYMRKVPVILLLAGTLFLALPTMYRVEEWSEPVAFWRNAVARDPKFSSLRLLLAAELLNEGKYQEAQTQLNTAYSLGLGREKEKVTYSELTAVAKRAEKNKCLYSKAIE